MEAEDWNEVTKLLTKSLWTSNDLEEKHGVHSHETNYMYLLRHVIWGHSFSSLNHFILCIIADVIVFLELFWDYIHSPC